MFTRCPGCKTVHPLNAALLAQGNGLYRCGSCNKVSNALQKLFDTWPEEDQKPSNTDVATRQPPILGDRSEEQVSSVPDLTREEAGLVRAAGFQDHQGNTQHSQKFWMNAAIAMLVVSLVNVIFVSGDELLAQPAIRSGLESIGIVEATPEFKYRDIDLLHLASSEMRSHPTLDETLILNATIVNRADQLQSFPALQITLFDKQNQPLARRVFKPGEYLQTSQGSTDGIAPGAYLPVIMELLDPGQHAVGFEMKFL